MIALGRVEWVFFLLCTRSFLMLMNHDAPDAAPHRRFLMLGGNELQNVGGRWQAGRTLGMESVFGPGKPCSGPGLGEEHLWNRGGLVPAGRGTEEHESHGGNSQVCRGGEGGRGTTQRCGGGSPWPSCLLPPPPGPHACCPPSPLAYQLVCYCPL